MAAQVIKSHVVVSNLRKFTIWRKTTVSVLQKHHSSTNIHPRHSLLSHKCVNTKTKLLSNSIQFTNYYGVHSSCVDDENIQGEDISEQWLEDSDYRQMFEEHYLLPIAGHRVAVIQPDYKMLGRKNQLTSCTLQLDEAAGLVETLPHWKVVDKTIYSVKHVNKSCIWGKGNFAEITEHLKSLPGLTAVLVGVNMLTGLQLATLQQEWGVPVYDRYTIVLQIFQTQARTREAKLQVALAEIPYLRSRLRGIHTGSLALQRGGLFVSGPQSRNVPMDTKKQLLQDRELKLKEALQKVQNQRDLLKKERKRRQIPTVAVVGYTNAGKTSLIRALTGDVNVRPRDQLFATLDVTVHQGALPSRMSVLYVDTVGFISDIPTDLIASFSATLRDMLDADAIIVVNDVSHPDVIWQQQTVHDTLRSLHLPKKLEDSIIQVNNKVDLLESPSTPAKDDADLAVSAVTGEGLSQLQKLVEDAVITSTDRLHKRLRIPTNGKHLSWLYKEATVAGTRVADDNTESLLVDIIMTAASYARFKQLFGKKITKKTSRKSKQ